MASSGTDTKNDTLTFSSLKVVSLSSNALSFNWTCSSFSHEFISMLHRNVRGLFSCWHLIYFIFCCCGIPFLQGCVNAKTRNALK